MLYTIEVRLIGGDFTTSMTQMRTWLDHQHVEPDGFRHSSGGAGITFRVDFRRECDALAFARVFGGRVIGQPLNTRNATLWSGGADAQDAEFGTIGFPIQPEHR